MPVDPFTVPLRVEDLSFVGSPLDRADVLRQDEAALERVLREPAARFLVFSNLRPLLTNAATASADAGVNSDVANDAAGSSALLWLAPGDLPAVLEDGERRAAVAPWIFLGLEDGRENRPRFALSASDDAMARDGLLARGEPVEVRAAAARVPAGQIEILAQARSLLAWHDRHQHCSVCGATTRSRKGGYQRKCESPACGAEHFPRTDPVVIMLVLDGQGRCLLARHGRRPTPSHVYTTLAGFVEPGESIEEAVAREVWEEAGLRIGRVRYIASQPWPFPSSLMIGCFAEATTREIRIDGTEIEDAAWFSKADVRATLAGAGPVAVPPPFAIAHTLIRTWAALDDGDPVG